MKAHVRWFIIPVVALAGVAAACQPPKKPPPPEPPPPTTQPPAPCPTSAAVGLDPFTQDALDDDWGEDRTLPSGGVTSVSFADCDDVAALGIDSTNPTATTSGFFLTEGLKSPPGMGVGDNFGNAVEINLYLDPAWEGTAVRAGLWVVGDDGLGDRDDLFGILEFVHVEPGTSTTEAPDITDEHIGWRYWDPEADGGNGDWVNSTAAFTYGEWVTLRIELDTDAEMYHYSLDGVPVASVDGGTNFIREVFVNHFNFGAHEFDTLTSDSYTGHWHAGA